MGDDSLVYGAPRINEEVARFTIETFICEFDQQFALLLVTANRNKWFATNG
jgi:hypothetical protein